MKRLLAALLALAIAGCVPAYAQTDGVPLRGPSGQTVNKIVGTACTQSGRTLTCNAGAGGTGSPGGVVNELQKNDGAGGFGVYTGTSCAYAVKTLSSTGAATCTAAPTIPADISGAHYVTTQAEAGLSAEAVLPTCSGTDKLTFNGTTISCATDIDTVYSLPALTATVLGGVKGNGALACSGTDKLSGFTSGGAMVCSSDTDTVYTLPTPTASTLGGVKSLTCSGTDKLSAIGTDGVPVCSTDQTGGGGGAPLGATYITETADATLTNEFAMGSLGTGLVLNATTTGVPTIYAGTTCSANQYMNALDASGVKTCAQVATSQLSGTITDAQLANNYSGVGACASGRFASTLNDNASPTCTQVAYADVSGTPTLQYQTVQDEASNLTQRTKINFTGTGVSCADNAGTSTTDCTVSSGGGSPGGSDTQVQYNNAGAFGGMANLINASGYATLPGASAPSAPSSGAKLYSEDRGGMSWPAFFTEQGSVHYVPRAPWSIDVSQVIPSHGATGTTVPQQFGITLAAAVGTVSNPAPVAGSSPHNAATVVVLTSAALANSASEWKGAQLNWLRGASADGDSGGFLFVARVANRTIPANNRTFYGMQGGTAALSVSAAPSATLNALYFGNDAGQTTLRFCGNDGTGTATCVDCGANFPSNSTTPIYELMIFAKPNDTAVYYYAKRLDTSVTACSGSVTASADLPGVATVLTPHLFCNNGGTASACAFSLIQMYLEKGI